MNRKFVFIILCLIFLGYFLYIFLDKNVYEDVYDFDVYSDILDIQKSEPDKNYDVFVTDTEITFQDSNGNSIIYVFDNDKLKNIFNVYNAKNEVDAKKIAAYFAGQIGSGEILNVNILDNVVSVQMDMKFFEEYKNYTKKQIEDILFKNEEWLWRSVI